MSQITITPANSPYTVNLTGSENLQASNVNIVTSGGSVSIILPAPPSVGNPVVTVVALNGSAAVSVAAGVLAVSNANRGASGYVSGVVGTANAGSSFTASVAGGLYWKV